MKNFSLWAQGDRFIFLAWLLLCLMSLAMLWSVTEPIQGPYEELDPGVAKGVFWRQVVWLGISYAGLLMASSVRLRYLENIVWPAFAFSLGLLALTLLFGPKIAGSQRWLALGPIRVQPSELAKVTYILVMGHLLGGAVDGGRKMVVTLTSLALTLLPMMLILREPDLGTSLVFLAMWVGLVFWYGVPGLLLLGAGSAAISAVFSFYSENVASSPWPWAIYLLLLLLVLYLARLSILPSVVLLAANILTGIGIPFFWEKLKGYQQERILTFFDPTRDAFGAGYQAIQSKVAIGSGGLFGTHYLQGTQKGLAFLPERHTDFIFSVLGEELGFFGSLFLLALFFIMLWRGVHHATVVRQPFARFVAIGVVTYFLFHVVTNVSITTGLLPVTGLPLPLMSYGGSNLLTSSVLVGLLLNVSSRSFQD
ncbi:rod shape-determining protein RodA [bacterium DOLZORAL124_64_63]|nr:MAG: rod shape-determining protein RodA [bacterium DOLZORAL124_64_63]